MPVGTFGADKITYSTSEVRLQRRVSRASLFIRLFRGGELEVSRCQTLSRRAPPRPRKDHAVVATARREEKKRGVGPWTDAPLWCHRAPRCCGAATVLDYWTGWPYPMSSKYSIPAAPAFGLALSPTPSVIFCTVVRLTPVRSLSGIFHCVQAAGGGGRRIRVDHRLGLAGLVLDRQVQRRRTIGRHGLTDGQSLPGAGDRAGGGDIRDLRRGGQGRIMAGHRHADVDAGAPSSRLCPRPAESRSCHRPNARP